MNGNIVSEKETNLIAIPSINSSTIAALDNGTFKMQGVVYDLSLSTGGILMYSLPMSQKSHAIQTPSIGLSVATILNHTDAMWRNV
ncbi:hypothetical protein EAY71_26570 [Vibrio anguillarum]|nr:hypothetical protein [Vibrio anguillarum]